MGKISMKFLHMISVISYFIILIIDAEGSECVSPQYVKLASTGLIQCSFQEDVFGVWWYNSTEIIDGLAFISVKNSVKNGKGFDSGEFDIYPNGTLIINNVSMQHEGNYTVVKIQTPISRTVLYDVRVLVIGAESTDEENLSSHWIISVVLAVVLVLLLTCGLVIFKVHNRRRISRRKNYRQHRHIYHKADMGDIFRLESTEDNGTISSENTEDKAQKQLFIKQLKTKYKQLYEAVQPIPYIRDRLDCVDRVFVEGGIEYFDGSWLPLDSHHSVFSLRNVKSKRWILIGEPGYGKSTLTLQYAYDWCNRTKTSPLKDVEILLFLQLRQLGGVRSIYKAIKQFTLPRNSQLNESEIKSVVETCSSVIVILDGFDEYPDAERGKYDVMKIIMGEMFGQFEVMLTTRYLPKQYERETKQLRLIGFDDRARGKYIRKAVVGVNVIAASKIKRRLQENPVLGDLCQVPLFFVMFAHMSHKNSSFQTFKTVTSFFQYMIKCFHSHMENQMDDANLQRYHMYESDHRKLDKVAFEGLSKQNQQIVWSKEELIYVLGMEFYDQYTGIGVLVEEEDIDNVDVYDNPAEQHQREVRFYHKVFCEWYAAHYLAEYAVRKSDKLTEVLRYMDPLDLQYCYRFACGLNPNAAGKIIEYVKQRQGGDKFAILCILEQSGRVGEVLGTVKSLCSKRIEFKEEDNKLLQRSTIQLLEIASNNKISISHVYLSNCYSTVDPSGEYHFQLKSNLYIPVLTTLNRIWITEESRKITEEEFTDILQYSSKCLALKELRFYDCLLPNSIQTESVSIFRSRNVKVYWNPHEYTEYCLNLLSGLWERIDPFTGHVMGVITDEDYQTEVRDLEKDGRKDRRL